MTNRKFLVQIEARPADNFRFTDESMRQLMHTAIESLAFDFTIAWEPTVTVTLEEQPIPIVHKG